MLPGPDGLGSAKNYVEPVPKAAMPGGTSYGSGGWGAAVPALCSATAGVSRGRRWCELLFEVDRGAAGDIDDGAEVVPPMNVQRSAAVGE